MKNIVLCCYFLLACLGPGLADTNNFKFPNYFQFGASNAAPQIEGGYLQDGRTESIWDRFVHENPDIIADRTNLDVTADSYKKYKEDVAILNTLGMNVYRFSISWSRLLPTGRRESLNALGVQYYRNLINELMGKGIEPLVTLYHWDLPQILLEDNGGWLNESTADLFADYARICYQLFGDDVKLWITLNEPKQVCQSGYGSGWFPPARGKSGIEDYICNKVTLLAHAKAWHIYNDGFKATQEGRVSIVLDGQWYEPGSDSKEDKDQAETSLQFTFGLYAHPVFKGDWPAIVKERIATRSKLEGFEESRLPAFTQAEIDYINGTYDFMAINHYTTSMMSAAEEPPIGTPSFSADIGGHEWKQPEWPKTNAGWFTVVPWGLRRVLVWLKASYGDVEIMITENGVCDSDGSLEDDHRVSYIRDYLSNLLDAVYQDDVYVTTYCVWSFIDDWEWSSGFTSRMGLYNVNFTDPERTRTPRRSSEYFTQITKNRCLVEPENCEDPPSKFKRV